MAIWEADETFRCASGDYSTMELMHNDQGNVSLVVESDNGELYSDFILDKKDVARLIETLQEAL